MTKNILYTMWPNKKLAVCEVSLNRIENPPVSWIV